MKYGQPYQVDLKRSSK